MLKDYERRYSSKAPCKVQLDNGQVRFMSQEDFYKEYGLEYCCELALAEARQKKLEELTAPAPMKKSPAKTAHVPSVQMDFDKEALIEPPATGPEPGAFEKPPAVLRGLPSVIWPWGWGLGEESAPDPWGDPGDFYRESLLRAILREGTPSLVDGLVALCWNPESLKADRSLSRVATTLDNLLVTQVLKPYKADSERRTDILYPQVPLTDQELAAIQDYLAGGTAKGSASKYSRGRQVASIVCPGGQDCLGIPADLVPKSWPDLKGLRLSEDAKAVFDWITKHARMRMAGTHLASIITSKNVAKQLSMAIGAANSALKELVDAGVLGSSIYDASGRRTRLQPIWPKLSLEPSEIEVLSKAILEGTGYRAPESEVPTDAESEAKGAAEHQEEKEPQEEGLKPLSGEVFLIDAQGTFLGSYKKSFCEKAFGSRAVFGEGFCQLAPLPEVAQAPSSKASQWVFAKDAAMALVPEEFKEAVQKQLFDLLGGDSLLSERVLRHVRANQKSFRGSLAAIDIVASYVSAETFISRSGTESCYASLAVAALADLLAQDFSEEGPELYGEADNPDALEKRCLKWAQDHRQDEDLKKRFVARRILAGEWTLVIFEKDARARALAQDLPIEHSPYDLCVVGLGQSDYKGAFGVALLETGDSTPQSVVLSEGFGKEGIDEAEAAAYAMVSYMSFAGRFLGATSFGRGATEGSEDVSESRLVVLDPNYNPGARGPLGHERKSPVPHPVRGHWRNQACGPGWSEHKRIWVPDFSKGDPDSLTGQAKAAFSHKVVRVVLGKASAHVA